jgi:DNA processing protein
MGCLKDWIALRMVEGVGCVGFRALLQTFGSPGAVFKASASALQCAAGIGPKTAGDIISFADWSKAEAEVSRAEALGVSLITCQDPLYPRNLLNIYDYPPYLYVKGSLVPDEIAVAIVGSRLASTYGKYVTEKLSRELALQGIAVISGMARGIDSAAHRGTLAAKGRTIAVLGSGIDVLYPPENETLAAEISGQGALVTEYPFGTPPNAPNFPARNRLISGISLGVVVVEAGEKSGSLITARIAAEQGRSVFAVPGAIESAGSRGTNRLIKQGARLIEGVEDILEEILPQAGLLPAGPETPCLFSAPEAEPAAKARASAASDEPGKFSEAEKRLLSLITNEPVDVDTLIVRSGLTAQEVQSGLLVLSLDGIIRQLPGKMYLRKE